MRCYVLSSFRFVYNLSVSMVYNDVQHWFLSRTWLVLWRAAPVSTVLLLATCRLSMPQIAIQNSVVSPFTWRSVGGRKVPSREISLFLLRFVAQGAYTITTQHTICTNIQHILASISRF